MLLPVPHKTHTVLIGSAGTGTGFAVACSIRRHWSHAVRIVAMDTNPRHLVTASLLAEAFESVPSSADPAFPGVLCELIERHSIDTYMPLIDEEIALASKLRVRGDLPTSLALLAPSAEHAGICLDKWHAATWMTRNDVPTPLTELASNPFHDEKYILKPRRGFGSKGVRIISLHELTQIPRDDLDNYVVQKICSYPEVTADCFFDPQRGFFRIACRERIETKSGVCTKARVFYDEVLAAIGERLAKGLMLHGSFCFQAMRSNEQWLVTDINARPGAGTALCAAIGLDFCAAALAFAWGIDARSCLPNIEGETFITRQYAEFVMN